MNNLQKPSLTNEVLDKIQDDKVKMKSKTYFAFKTLLILLGVLVVVTFVLYLVSLIIFTLKVSGAWYLPGFGLSGTIPLLKELPLLLTLMAIALIVALELFVKYFAFSYRRPVLYSLLGIIIVVMLGSFMISETTFHQTLFQKSLEGKLPVAGKIYSGYGMMKSHNVSRGVVIEIMDSEFLIKSPRGKTLKVIIDSDTDFYPERNIEKGNAIIILGKRDGDTIYADEIKKINDNINLLSSPNMMMKMNKQRIPLK